MTKAGQTEEYGYGLPWKDVQEEVEQHYNNGADAVELEMMTEEEFNAKIADFINSDEFETRYIPETNELKVYAE